MDKVTGVPSSDTLRDLNLSKNDILALDPQLFSDEQKKFMIEGLYGKPDETSWKSDLQSTSLNLKRWEKYLDFSSTVAQSEYRRSHEDVVSRAKRSKVESFSPYVTHFTDWIFRLYFPIRNELAMQKGRALEKGILLRKLPLPDHSKWKLIYNGMSVSDSPGKKISALSVHDQPLYGKPDLVFREKKTGRILINEIKVSPAHIPSDGWPNLRAQLWAYSQIDDWVDAPEIILISEIWWHKPDLRVRDVLHWNGRDHEFDEQNRELFRIYREKALMINNINED